METSLIRGDRNYSGFLKEIAPNARALYRSALVKVNLQILSEPARILVSHRLAVPECLQDRVTGQYLALQMMLLLLTLLSTQPGQHLHTVFS